jgi:superfamily II DNA/RNA helicase
VGESIFKGSGINILSLIGGANVRNQIKRLRDQKPQIIVATPGRLAELVFQLRKLRLGMVRALVIDEVDSMLKEPFIGEILTIIEATAMFKKDFNGDARTGLPAKQAEGVNSVYGYVADNDSRYDNEDEENDDETLDGDDDDEEEEEEEEAEEGEEEVAPHLNSRLVCLASATVNDPAVKVKNATSHLTPPFCPCPCLCLCLSLPHVF